MATKKRKKTKTPYLGGNKTTTGLLVLILLIAAVFLISKYLTQPSIPPVETRLKLISCNVDSSTRRYSCDIQSGMECDDTSVVVADALGNSAYAVVSGASSLGSLEITKTKLSGELLLTDLKEPIQPGKCSFIFTCNKPQIERIIPIDSNNCKIN